VIHASGVFDSRPAFLAEIDACCHEGGGRVVVPSGNGCAGPIVLRSIVTFHLRRDDRRAGRQHDDYRQAVTWRVDGKSVRARSVDARERRLERVNRVS